MCLARIPATLRRTCTALSMETGPSAGSARFLKQSIARLEAMERKETLQRSLESKLVMSSCAELTAQKL